MTTLIARLREACSYTYCEGCQNERSDAADEIERLRKLAKLPLLFYRAGYWTSREAVEWESITGEHEATTRIMCDTIRNGLK